MKSAAKIARFTLLGLILGAFLHRGLAETDGSDIRIISSFVAAGEPVPAECGAQAHAFAESLVRFPRPGSWHWILLCDEAGWQRFLRLSGRGGREDIYASTDLQGRATYLRGARLLHSGDSGVEMDVVVAHELAHIRLRGGDEWMADRMASGWRQGLNEPKQYSCAGKNTRNCGF